MPSVLVLDDQGHLGILRHGTPDKSQTQPAHKKSAAATHRAVIAYSSGFAPLCRVAPCGWEMDFTGDAAAKKHQPHA